MAPSVYQYQTNRPFITNGRGSCHAECPVTLVQDWWRCGYSGLVVQFFYSMFGQETIVGSTCLFRTPEIDRK